VRYHLDTHIVLWLYDNKEHLLSKKVTHLLSKSELAISPIISVELAFLNEVGKIKTQPDKIITFLTNRIDLEVADISFVSVCSAAKYLQWTRDPFDRLIVASSMVAKCGLITKDETIRKNYKQAVF